jgi:hypothetical protein
MAGEPVPGEVVWLMVAGAFSCTDDRFSLGKPVPGASVRLCVVWVGLSAVQLLTCGHLCWVCGWWCWRCGGRGLAVQTVAGSWETVGGGSLQLGGSVLTRVGWLHGVGAKHVAPIP